MIENELRQSLDALERHAPAETDVFTGVQAGIRRRRRRRQITNVAGVAGVASAVALGVVFATTPGDNGSPTGLAPASSATATVPAAPSLPFTAGWLPSGYHLDTWRVSETFGSAQYVGGGDFRTVVVWVSDQVDDPLPEAVDEPTTVAGRPGTLRRLGPGQTQLIWQLPDNRWAVVSGTEPAVPLDALRRVAENVTGTPTALDVDLALSALPAGYDEISWADGSPTVCQTADTCVTLTLHQGKAPARVQGPLVVTAEEKADLDPTWVPVDQKQIVDGTPVRTTADGRLAIVQVDATHWAKAFSTNADPATIREAVTLVEVD